MSYFEKQNHLGKISLICVDNIISSKTSAIDCISIISLAFVVTGIHLGRRIDFHLRFHGVVAQWPLMYLRYDLIYTIKYYYCKFYIEFSFLPTF